MIADQSTTRVSPIRMPGARTTLLVGITSVDGTRVIHVTGELDVATRGVVHGACVVDDAHDVIVDLHLMTFLDCGGYSGLMAARAELEDRGGSITLIGATAQPARLLSLLDGSNLSRKNGAPSD